MIPKKFTESGQALVIIALAAVVLFGFTALAIDGSAKFSDRRHAQNAADAAALAGALSLVNNETTACGLLKEWECKAFLRAEDNGYDNFTNNQVWVFRCNDPARLAPDVPLNCGAYEGNADYIEVIIYSDINTTFARVFGWEQFHNLVQAVTYAKPGKNLAEGAMIISYDDSPNCSTGGTGGYSVSISGNSSVNLHGGGILLNSDEVCGFTIPNCADLNITGGGGINTVGANNINTTGCTFDPPLSNNYNQPPIIIPDDVSWPDEPPQCGMTPNTPYKFPTQILGADNKMHDQWLIHPGYYTDFPNTSLVTNKSYIYMASGVYCIDLPANQDLSWSAVDAAALIGSTDPSVNPYHTYNPDGVTLYIKQANGFAINGNGPTYLDATNDPDSDYQGYLIILKGTHTDHPTCTINGGAVIDMNGLIYAPYCNFIINGKAGETADINAQLIGWDIKVNGANTINFNYNPSYLVKIKRRIGLMK